MNNEFERKEWINFKQYYLRLKRLGFDKKYIQKNVLPDWWCLEYQETKGAIVDAVSYACRRLNIDYESLAYKHNIPKFNQT
jgi:hypothetical protein